MARMACGGNAGVFFRAQAIATCFLLLWVRKGEGGIVRLCICMCVHIRGGVRFREAGSGYITLECAKGLRRRLYVERDLHVLFNPPRFLLETGWGVLWCTLLSCLCIVSVFCLSDSSNYTCSAFMCPPYMHHVIGV